MATSAAAAGIGPRGKAGRSFSPIAWTREKLIEPLRAMTLREQVLCVLVGVLGGVFPIPMLTTLVTLGLARLAALGTVELAVAASINFVMTPLELVLIPLLVQIGGSIVPSSLVGKANAEVLIFDLSSTESTWAVAGQALCDLLVLACVPWAIISGLLLVVASSLLPLPTKKVKAH